MPLSGLSTAIPNAEGLPEGVPKASRKPSGRTAEVEVKVEASGEALIFCIIKKYLVHQLNKGFYE